MSSDLYEAETTQRLADLRPTETLEEAGVFEGFVRGAGLGPMRLAASAARGVSLAASIVPITQDFITGGTEAQDRYFRDYHDPIFQSAVEHWTPRPGEVGLAGQVTGELLGMLPLIVASPTTAVATLLMREAEDLTRQGADPLKATAAGAVQAAGLGLGIWVPILGRTLAQRALLGGAGFNVVQGGLTRAGTAELMKDNPAIAEAYGALDPTHVTLDVLLGLAFGGMAHVSPAMRAQGAEALGRLQGWLENAPVGTNEALATMRQAQHSNADSLPGIPVEPKDQTFHVERVREAIEQLARNEQVDVSAIPEPTLTPMPEVQAERAAQLEELVAAAEAVRVEEGLPPAPDPAAEAPPRPMLAEDLTLVPLERQAQALGRAVESRLLELKVGEQEARANAAIWEAFFQTTSAKYGVRVDDLVQAYGIDVRRMSRSEMALDALTQREDPALARAAEPGYRALHGQADQAQGSGRAPDARQEPEDLRATVAGGRPAQGWARATRASRKGRPIPLYRGGRADLRPESFGPDSLGAASGNPSSGLGVWFTPSKAEAATYGKAQEAYLDIRNPKIVKIEDLPGFESVAAATKWREELRAQGHDSIIVTAKHLGGKTHLVVFNPEQVIPSAPAARAPGETLFQSQAKSPIIQTAKKVQERWYSELERQIGAANMKAAPAKGWKDYLKSLAQKGVKAEELKWSGIEEWLDLQQGRVSKEQVQEFLKANGVKIEEVKLGAAGERTLADQQVAGRIQQLEELGFTTETDPVAEMHNMPGEPTRIAFLDKDTGDINDAQDLRRFAQQAIEDGSEGADGKLQRAARLAIEVEEYWYGSKEPTEESVAQEVYGRSYEELDPATRAAVDTELDGRIQHRADPTKFGTYQLPGGKNYRELLLKLPEPDTEKFPKGYKVVEVDQTQRQALEQNLTNLTEQWRAWLAENEYEQLSADDWLTRYGRIAGLPREHLRFAKNFSIAWDNTQGMLTNEARYTLVGPDGTGQVLRGAQNMEQATDQAMTLLDNQGVLDRGVFRESHWEMSNVLAHVRYNERTDTDGKRVLFIEEIQSDWAQKGKKRGFAGGPENSELVKQHDAASIESLLLLGPAMEAVARNRNLGDDSSLAALNWALRMGANWREDYEATTGHGISPEDARAVNEWRAATTRELDLEDRLAGKKSGVPAAPFVSKTEAWVGLVLKRMIREAAERGFERVAWTTGEQQTNRYTSALRKAVDEIEWKKTEQGVQIVGYKSNGGRGGERPVLRNLREEVDRVLRDHDNLGFDFAAEARQAILQHQDWAARWDVEGDESRRIINNWRMEYLTGPEAGSRKKVVDTTEKEDVLSDAIGKAMADRIINDPNQTGTISGDGIVVADTGMASFYDRIVPNVAKEILRKLGGGKIERTKIETGKALSNEPPELDTRRTEPPNMLPFEEGGGVAEAFQGAEPFRNGDQPLYGEGTVKINGVEHDVAVVAERDGIHIISNGEPDFEMMLENLQIGAGTRWDADFAKRLVDDMWRGTNSLIERFTVIRGEVQGKSAPTEQMAFDITPELRERAISGMPLFQGPERGAIRLGPNTVIGLFEQADASTFAHESAHLFLQMTRDLASRGGAPLQALDDWSAIARWLKVEGGELTREQHEKFATTFERYLAEGKAPSEELRSVFQAFRDWLLAIYKSLAGIAEDIPDEIRGVMDRMLVSQRRDPAPKAEGPPAAKAEPPPPPGEAEATARPEARGWDEDWRTGLEESARPGREPKGLEDLQVRETVQMMAETELGWETIGGRRADASISTTSGQPNFTKWVPKSELWPGRPDKSMNEGRTREAVRKALAGEKLKAAEQRMIDYMLEVANKRLEAVDYVGGPEEWNLTAQELATEGLEPGSQNVLETDMVARAMEKDELAVESAAVKYENDDAGFMAQVRKILGKDLQDKAADERGEAGEGEARGERRGEPGQGEDPVAAAANEYVESNPEQLIDLGVDAEGNPVQKTIRQYLDDALEEAAQAREDAGLVRSAAKCLLGRA